MIVQSRFSGLRLAKAFRVYIRTPELERAFTQRKKLRISPPAQNRKRFDDTGRKDEEHEMFGRKSFNEFHLRQKLAMERQLTSLIDKELVAQSNHIVFERENWVDAFVDHGHKVSFDNGTTIALRGITVNNARLFWLVRREDKKCGYHATTSDPLAAVEEAENAWWERKLVRQKWNFVEELARDLITGRRRFRVRIEDALASPLCSLGVQTFMQKIFLANVREVSGRFAACLMKVEPQVGFVIHQAYLRQEKEAGQPYKELSQYPDIDRKTYPDLSPRKSPPGG